MEPSFPEAMATAPPFVQYWLNWLAVVMFVFPVCLVFFKQTRIMGIIIFISSVLSMAGIFLLYQYFGYVRLLSLPHFFVWVPLMIYLYRRLKNTDIPKIPRALIIVFFISVSASLVLDTMNVVRYLLGETEVLYKS